MRRFAWTAVLAIATLASREAAAESVAAADDPQGIYGGEPVGACAWPSALYIGGCTGSLVHPRMVVLAAHCVAWAEPDEVRFGENFQDPERTIALSGCAAHPQWGQGMPGDGQHDIAICEIAEAVEDVPIVPILMGCEAEMLQPGAVTTLVGYGQADDQLGMGPKREVVTDIKQVGTDAIWIGDAVHSGCYGDSGGPAYLMLPDGSWRVFGATSGASTQSPDCPQTGIWTLIHPHVPWIEETSGLDITPCHDADGTWNPGEDCTEFPLAPGLGGGDWASGCAGEASGIGESCGPGFVGGTDTGESTGAADESSSSGDLADEESTSETGDDSGSTGDPSESGTTESDRGDTGSIATTVPLDEDDESNGCGCTSGAPDDQGVWRAFALLCVLLSTRRKH